MWLLSRVAYLSLHHRVMFSRLGRASPEFRLSGLPDLVGLDGLEPSTSRLSGARSSHLSYRPLFHSWAYWFIHRADSWFPDIDSILLSTLAVKNGIRTFFSSCAREIGFG